jgi:hypothetical protein
MSTRGEQIWMDLATTILSAIKSTADKISATWPQVTLVEKGYWNTEVFPLSIYAGFKNSLAPESEEDIIVISVDFKREGKTIEVIADISREQGETFDMTPAVYIPADEGGSISEEKAEEIGETIARYIQDRWELIGKELSKASDS